jgi:hypothetical protein
MFNGSCFGRLDGWLVKLQLVLASTAILRSGSRRFHDHVFLSRGSLRVVQLIILLWLVSQVNYCWSSPAHSWFSFCLTDPLYVASLQTDYLLPQKHGLTFHWVAVDTSVTLLWLQNSDFQASCYNIKMDIREIGWESVDWIHLAQIGISGGLLWAC